MSILIPQAENRVVLSDISWATFEALLADADHRGSRFTYDQGILEIMSPSSEHEWLGRLIGRMLETLTEEIGIPVRSGGSTTLKDELKQRGLEPDECYYITNEPAVRGLDEIDLGVNPPPDLAIEIDITSSSMDQLGIYAALGVPEVWMCDGKHLKIYRLQDDGAYAKQDRSPTFPSLPPETILDFLARRKTTDETSWIKSFREWVRKNVIKEQ
ncbi:MAG: Uma2 family endonuclease [Thermoguttaceae bacterium]